MIDDILITKENFDAIRHLSKNIDMSQRVLPYALEAQRFDVKPILGDKLYFDLIKNKSLKKYKILLDGGEYVSPCTPKEEAGEYIEEGYIEPGYYISSIGTAPDTYFDGLKLAIAYFAMARFRLNQQINDTNFGVVRKQTEFSEPVEDKTLYRSHQELRHAANAVMGDVEKFLKVNAKDYPHYINFGCCGSPEKTNKIKFSTLISRV